MNRVPRTRRLREESGFTLVEMMVATMIFSLLLAAVLSSLDSATKAERGQQQRHSAMLEIRQAMTQFTKDLRQATAIDRTTSSHTVVEMDTLISGVAHHVKYTVALVDATKQLYEFRRELDGGTPEVVVTNMVINTTANPDPAFCYQWDSSSVPPVCIDPVDERPPLQLSAIRVTLATAPAHNPSEPITLATDIDLRNI